MTWQDAHWNTEIRVPENTNNLKFSDQCPSRSNLQFKLKRVWEGITMANAQTMLRQVQFKIRPLLCPSIERLLCTLSNPRIDNNRTIFHSGLLGNAPCHKSLHNSLCHYYTCSPGASQESYFFNLFFAAGDSFSIPAVF